MRHTTDLLRLETRSLSSALRKPQVRGQWGELHLRRSIELAGMVAHCDFVEQQRLDDGARRPDVVIHLAGGRQLVVDAKVPLDAFLDACATDDDDVRERHLAGTPPSCAATSTGCRPSATGARCRPRRSSW